MPSLKLPSHFSTIQTSVLLDTYRLYQVLYESTAITCSQKSFHLTAGMTLSSYCKLRWQFLSIAWIYKTKVLIIRNVSLIQIQLYWTEYLHKTAVNFQRHSYSWYSKMILIPRMSRSHQQVPTLKYISLSFHDESEGAEKRLPLSGFPCEIYLNHYLPKTEEENAFWCEKLSIKLCLAKGGCGMLTTSKQRSMEKSINIICRVNN